MSRRRLGSAVALGCLLLLASHCRRGGAENVQIWMPDVVEAEFGERAVIKCEASLPENVSYVYVNWFSMEKGKQERKMLLTMTKGKQAPEGRLSISDDFSLIISKVVLQDAKNYICQVSAGRIGVGENRSELHVSKAPEKPRIERTNHGITASEQKKHQIATCISNNGYPTPVLTWYKDSVLLQPDGKGIEIIPAVTKQSNGLITVSSTLWAQVTKEDRDAHFSCQVNYRLMGRNKTSKSESFQVNVLYPSETFSFVVEPPNTELKEGDNVTLRCEADGNPPPIYTLSRAEEETSLNADNGLLHLYNVKKTDSGVYQCKMLDLESTLEVELVANVTLFVNYIDTPVITPVTSGPSIEQLQEGDDVVLTCNATGSQPLEFHWEKESKLLAKGNVLNLTSVGYETTGKYVCNVSVPEIRGLSQAAAVEVFVHAKPVLVPQKDVVFVQEGETMNLTCTAFSVPLFSISWTTNGTTHLITQKHQRTSVHQFQVTEALLESGVNCSARNKIGTTSHHFKLALRPKMVAPEDKAEQKPPESKGVIIVAVVICILAIAVLGAVLYFLHKKGKLTCGRSGKQEISKAKAQKDEIVVEVKSDKLPEEAGLLQGANGEKRSAGDQGEKYIDLRN